MEAWKKQLEEILKQIPGYNPWDQAGAAKAFLDHYAALRAINWFPEHLKHVEGSARGTEFVLRGWQAAIVGNLFGWKRLDDQGRTVRRYRQMLLYVPRGNGKTPLVAGIILYGFFEDGEPGAQNYLAAKDREQAGYLFRNASGMVEQDAELLERVTIYRGDQRHSMVLNDDPLSFLKIVPGEARHGGIPHMVGVDELHEQPNRALLESFESALVKQGRAQPLLAMMTTADYDRESVCNDIYAYACRVRDNGGDPDKPGLDPHFLPVIYDTAQDEDWRLPAVWERCNPNIGVSVSREELANACRKAQESPALENTFRRLNLNQKTKQEMRLISEASWLAAHPKDDDFSVEELNEGECFGGLDLASNDDLASLSLVFPLSDDAIAILCFSWCPQARVVKRAAQKYPYDAWSRNGYPGATDCGIPKFLTPTEGDWIDFDEIQRTILALREKYYIREIGYDPHGASQLMQNLIAEGMDVIPIPATFRNLAGPTKDLYRRVQTRRVYHFGNPVLRWAIGNAAVHFDGKLPPGAKIEECLDKVPIMLSKRKSADKIDPAAATVLALARMGQYPTEGGSSMKVESV